jgi:hypothetical protein
MMTLVMHDDTTQTAPEVPTRAELMRGQWLRNSGIVAIALVTMVIVGYVCNPFAPMVGLFIDLMVAWLVYVGIHDRFAGAARTAWERITHALQPEGFADDIPEIGPTPTDYVVNGLMRWRECNSRSASGEVAATFGNLMVASAELMSGHERLMRLRHELAEGITGWSIQRRHPPGQWLSPWCSDPRRVHIVRGLRQDMEVLSRKLQRLRAEIVPQMEAEAAFRAEVDKMVAG